MDYNESSRVNAPYTHPENKKINREITASEKKGFGWNLAKQPPDNTGRS